MGIVVLPEGVDVGRGTENVVTAGGRGPTPVKPICADFVSIPVEF